MKSFELLPHTADVRIKAKGSTLGYLFEAALEGLCKVIQPDYPFMDLDYTIIIEFEIKSFDETSLLIDFLSYVLTRMHNIRAIFPKVDIKELESGKMKAIIYGANIEGFATDVKAVTYHEAEIIIKDNFYETMIVLDI